MYLRIDIGSTTIKTVLCDRNGDILYSNYRRHNTDITATAAADTAPEEAHGTSCPTGTDGADMEQERLTTRRFETSDRGRTIVVPYFAEGYSEFIPSVLKVMGYDAISLPPGTQDDVETGLRCANNDICYPATIVVGSVINFLKSGKLPREKTAVIMYQTGGQCRATNYFALIQNAMCAEGFSDIPLISISKNPALTANQPGFNPDWKHNLRLIIYTVLYADCLSKLYHTAVTREKQKGRAASLRHKYTELGKALILRRDCRGLKDLTGQAAREFAAAIRTELHPRIIGIVGEIYVKYNSFSNKDVVRWLNRHGIETAVPSVYNFFISAFANRHINKREHIKKLQTRSGPPMPCTCGCAAAPGHLTVPARHARDTVRSPMSLRMQPRRPG